MIIAKHCSPRLSAVFNSLKARNKMGGNKEMSSNIATMLWLLVYLQFGHHIALKGQYWRQKTSLHNLTYQSHSAPYLYYAVTGTYLGGRRDGSRRGAKNLLPPLSRLKYIIGAYNGSSSATWSPDGNWIILSLTTSCSWDVTKMEVKLAIFQISTESKVYLMPTIESNEPWTYLYLLWTLAYGLVSAN